MIGGVGDPHAAEVVSPPEIITKGWVYAPEAEELLVEARDVVTDALTEAIVPGPIDIENLRRRARGALGKFVSERTRRRPMIVPVVMQV